MQKHKSAKSSRETQVLYFLTWRTCSMHRVTLTSHDGE